MYSLNSSRGHPRIRYHRAKSYGTHHVRFRPLDEQPYMKPVIRWSFYWIKLTTPEMENMNHWHSDADDVSCLLCFWDKSAVEKSKVNGIERFHRVLLCFWRSHASIFTNDFGLKYLSVVDESQGISGVCRPLLLSHWYFVTYVRRKVIRTISHQQINTSGARG
jgi:hypothetical protein